MKATDIFPIVEERNFVKWVIELYGGTLVEVLDEEDNIIFSLDTSLSL